MLRRLTASAALAAAATVTLSATPALAYEPANPAPGLSVVVGGNITFTSDGFAPGSNVSVSLVDADGTALAALTLTADENGELDYTFNLNLSGVFQLIAAGQDETGQSVGAGAVVNVDNNSNGAVSNDNDDDDNDDDDADVDIDIDVDVDDNDNDVADANTGSSNKDNGAVIEVSADTTKPAAATVAAGTASTAAAQQLAHTGDDFAVQLWAGAGLVSVGGALVALTVVRRRQADAL